MNEQQLERFKATAEAMLGQFGIEQTLKVFVDCLHASCAAAGCSGYLLESGRVRVRFSQGLVWAPFHDGRVIEPEDEPDLPADPDDPGTAGSVHEIHCRLGEGALAVFVLFFNPARTLPREEAHFYRCLADLGSAALASAVRAEAARSMEKVRLAGALAEMLWGGDDQRAALCTRTAELAEQVGREMGMSAALLSDVQAAGLLLGAVEGKEAGGARIPAGFPTLERAGTLLERYAQAAERADDRTGARIGAFRGLEPALRLLAACRAATASENGDKKAADPAVILKTVLDTAGA